MKKTLITFLFVGSQLSLAQEVALQFEQANQLYRIGDYKQAASFYEKIGQNGYESPALFYNLGNSYFKLKNMPAAIVNYERARLLSPHDEDIAYNLRLANLRIIDRIEPIPQLFFVEWWRSFVSMFSSGTWASLAVVLLWCASIGGATFLFLRPLLIRRLTFLICAICLLCSVLSYASMFQQRNHERTDQDAIVFAASIAVKSSPDQHSTDLFVLHEGVKVELLDAVGEWKKIRLADGKVGWIPVESILVI